MSADIEKGRPKATPPDQGQYIVIPDVTGKGVHEAALAYAAAGLYIGPVAPRKKNPGSVLGKGWPEKSSRTPEQITRWFGEHPDRAIFLDCGKSGLVVINVDRPDRMPDVLERAIVEHEPPFHGSRLETDPDRGHFLFAVPPGRKFGNGAGPLAGCGEVRGAGGVIILAPSVHEEDSGHYQWRDTGPVPVLPDYIAAVLPDGMDSSPAASSAAVDDFLAEHTVADRPELLDVHCAAFSKAVAADESRHDTMKGHLVGAMKEAAAGLVSAQAAADTLEALFRDAKGADIKQGEWAGLLAWAVAQAMNAPTEETLARVSELFPSAADDFAVLLAEGDPSELRRQFPRLDLAALLDPNRPQREWVWHGLIPAGASVSLVAAAGSLKSLVVLALALALTRRAPEFAGLPIPRQRRCLLVDMENTEDDLAERMRDLGMRQEDDLGELNYLHLPVLPALDGPVGGELLIKICDEYGLQRGDLVVLDSFQRVVEGPEDKSDTYRAFYTHTAAGLKRRGLTVLRTDNTGKEMVRGARGSSGKRDDVDLELQLVRDGSRLTITPGKSRLAGIERLELTFGADDDGQLTFTSAGDPFRDGVVRVKSLLDAWGKPADYSQRAAAADLKAAGDESPRDVVRQAVKERKECAADFGRNSAPSGHGAPLRARSKNSAPSGHGASRRTESEAG